MSSQDGQLRKSTYNGSDGIASILVPLFSSRLRARKVLSFPFFPNSNCSEVA